MGRHLLPAQPRAIPREQGPVKIAGQVRLSGSASSVGAIPRQEPWIRLASAPARRVCTHKSTNSGAFSRIGLRMWICADERERLRTRMRRNSAAAARSHQARSGLFSSQISSQSGRVSHAPKRRIRVSISTTYCASRPVAMPDFALASFRPIQNHHRPARTTSRPAMIRNGRCVEFTRYQQATPTHSMVTALNLIHKACGMRLRSGAPAIARADHARERQSRDS
jgi:hypothetical protein